MFQFQCLSFVVRGKCIYVLKQLPKTGLVTRSTRKLKGDIPSEEKIQLTEKTQRPAGVVQKQYLMDMSIVVQ